MRASTTSALTVCLLTGRLGNRVPWLNLTHHSGHVPNDLVGLKGDAHINPLHLVSYALIGAEFLLIATAWRRLWAVMRPFGPHGRADGIPALPPATTPAR